MKNNWKILVGILIGIIITLIVIICIPVLILLFLNVSKEALDATHTMDRTIDYSTNKKVELQYIQQNNNNELIEILKQDTLSPELEKYFRKEHFLSKEEEMLFITD